LASYYTIKGPSEGIYKEKGSKFLAFAYPVSDESHVKERLDKLRKQYFDARHHCYAYIIGNSSGKYRSYDDGEPNHSAGDPILGQLRSKGLTYTLVVVVRYFGGTKLGVGGLIEAYKTASKEALDNATVLSIEIKESVRFSFHYDKTNEVMRLVREFDIEIEKQIFTEVCQLNGRIVPEAWTLLLEKAKLIGGIELTRASQE